MGMRSSVAVGISVAASAEAFDLALHPLRIPRRRATNAMPWLREYRRAAQSDSMQMKGLGGGLVFVDIRTYTWVNCLNHLPL